MSLSRTKKTFKKATKRLCYLYPASMTYIERKESEERTRYKRITKNNKEKILQRPTSEHLNLPARCGFV